MKAARSTSRVAQFCPSSNSKKSNGVARNRPSARPSSGSAARAPGSGFSPTAPIRKGKFIIEYCGKRVLWKYVDNLKNRYLFDLNTRWAIDGSVRRNTARYINHSCKPNAMPYEVKGKIKIYAKRTIQPGEEITYDYGKEYFDISLSRSAANARLASESRSAARRLPAASASDRVPAASRGDAP